MTPQLCRTALIAALLLLFASPSINAQVPTDSTAPASDRKVEIRINGRAVKEATIQSGEVSMDTTRLTVRSGDEVKSLLKQRGIVPDASAIALFYQLNPRVRDADALTVGSSVTVPTLKAQNAEGVVTRGRVTYAVLADTAYRTELVEKAKRLTQLTERLRTESNDPLAARRIDASADKIEGDIRTVARSSIPLSHETATDLSASLDAFQKGVEESLKNQGSAHAKLSETGTHVAAEAAAIAAASRTGTNMRAEVPVEVIDTTGQSVGNVMIAYARPMFAKTGPPKERFAKVDRAQFKKSMDIGRWTMWVENFTKVSLSDSLTVTVTNPSEVVTLVVIKGR
jgi:hypothetical protein